ncbi:MAG: HAD family hydrolase [Candidatus Kariarchaeaceae archaeon]
MGICTSNESKSARILMEKAGLNEYFDIYIGSEDLEERKPSPEPLFFALKRMKQRFSHNQDLRENIWFVGDTKYDVEAAQNANILSIGITHESTAEIMLSSNPDIIVDSISALYDSINKAWS